LQARHAGLLAALSAVWGGSYLLIKLALEDLQPAVIVWGRCVLAAAVLVGLMAVSRGGADLRAAARLARRRPGVVLVHGVLAITLPFLLITFGELAVPSGLTAVLLAPASLWVAAFAPFADPTERADGRGLVGMVMGLGGVALLVGVESVDRLAEFLGAMAILAASASYGASGLYVKRRLAGLSPVATSALSTGVTAALTLPVALASWPAAAPGARAALAVLALGLVGTALAFVGFYRLMAAVGTARASLISYCAPGVALFYGAAFYGEEITPAAVAGLALILAGVGLASLRRGR
jgi:drug/metabolite transporter (DMT)-like permease